MLPKWLDHLADPETHEPLVLEADASDGLHVLTGRLRALAGGRAYPIIQGVPRFVDEHFYNDGPADSVIDQTVQCYGEFWRRADTARGSGAHTPAERKANEEVFHAMLGVRDSVELASLFKDGTNCLDAGCGIAWSEYLFNVNENANRFAIDLSTSVEVAFDRTRALSNVLVAQADLFRLPFPESHFDIIFSGGVLHHTPDPAKAFASLCRHLRPGGLIGIFVYKTKPFLRELADREIKKITTEMTASDCEAFAAQMASLGRALQRITEPLVVDQDIPLLGIARGRYNVQKFIFDHFLKCYHNADLGLDHSVLANLDWYRPKQASHHEREEIASWFEGNGVRAVRFAELPGWEHSSFFVSGRKPR
jgi:SAM-dependent methyltransferase/uncharacterized protein YbaR (Trm112 family)